MAQRWPQFAHDPATPWWALVSKDTAGPVAAPPVSHFPLPGWPAQNTVEYLTKLIVLGLLLLALPYLIGKLMTSPEEVLVATSERVIAKGPVSG